MRNSSCSSSSSTGMPKSKTTPCCSKVGMKRGPWTPEEDELLAAYISREGEGRWRTLPNRAGLLRCGKSCRLRWMNYLRPSVKRGHIAPDEEDLILRLHRLLGNRWSLIAGRIPGRTDNEIKNYWNTHLSKKLISQGIDPRTHTPLNPNPNSHAPAAALPHSPASRNHNTVPPDSSVLDDKAGGSGRNGIRKYEIAAAGADVHRSKIMRVAGEVDEEFHNSDELIMGNGNSTEDHPNSQATAAALPQSAPNSNPNPNPHNSSVLEDKAGRRGGNGVGKNEFAAAGADVYESKIMGGAGEIDEKLHNSDELFMGNGYITEDDDTEYVLFSSFFDSLMNEEMFLQQQQPNVSAFSCPEVSAMPSSGLGGVSESPSLSPAGVSEEDDHGRFSKDNDRGF